MGVTLFEVVYGRKHLVNVITKFLQGETKVEAVQQELIDLDGAANWSTFRMTSGTYEGTAWP